MNGFDPALRRQPGRVARGESPRVLDLFAGAGRLSPGFQRAGFRIYGAMEIDSLAARTHARNFRPGDLGRYGVPRDIANMEPEEPNLDEVYVRVGGPPRQACARFGRANLREVADHPSAFKADPWGNLYLRYFAWAKALRPLALLVEIFRDISRIGATILARSLPDASSNRLLACSYVANQPGPAIAKPG